MGASAWHYRVRYDSNPKAVLHRLHEEVLATGDYYWRADVPKPTSLAGLHALYGDAATEHLAEEGTHSILDIHQVGRAGAPDDFGTILPLPEKRVRAVFGTATPTAEQFDAAYQNGMDTLDDFPRWSGRYTTLYENGAPSEVVVWGVSGD
ncbi:hypothetical protein ACFQV2_16470 [Actinokineospora soli]|uniref:GyrI-like small molecule binding domain-containing protein n=1 Tax=Actinokineospora soli TaxID=1048753 RepID=A0ABW2TM79_9PSEU